MNYKTIAELKEELGRIDERRQAIEKLIILYANLPEPAAKYPWNMPQPDREAEERLALQS